MLDSVLMEYQTKLQNRLDILLSESDLPYNNVIKAARYSLLSGGKRIRPVLLLEFYRLCGGEDDCAYNFAAAIEMIHTYSLIHDDLPCMDNDDMRRGRPSCHKQFDEATALLAGDALLTEAFSAAAKTIGIPEERVVRAISVLSSFAGIQGMIGGQMIDLENEGKTVTAAQVLEMYSLKTGALIKSAVTIGCILAGASEEKIAAACSYGEKLGLAFQLVDDILDYEGDAQLLGKPIGSDEKNGKQTVASILGLEKCKEMAAKLTSEAHSALEIFEGADIGFITSLTDHLLSRTH